MSRGYYEATPDKHHIRLKHKITEPILPELEEKVLIYISSKIKVNANTLSPISMSLDQFCASCGAGMSVAQHADQIIAAIDSISNCTIGDFDDTVAEPENDYCLEYDVNNMNGANVVIKFSPELAKILLRNDEADAVPTQ